MLEGHVFSEQTFGVEMFALFINQFLGGNNGIIESYKNAMVMTNTANSITIDTGAAVIQGRLIKERTGTIIDYAKTDNLYCSLIVEIDLGQTNTETVLNQLQYKILENVGSYPALIQNDIINQTGNIYQFELARFQNGATGIVNFTDRRTYLRGDINLDTIYPTGSVYISKNNTNPHDLFGGTWELFDKKFKTDYKFREDNTYTTFNNISSASQRVYWEENHIKLTLRLETNVDLADTVVTLCTLNLANLGVTSLLSANFVVAYSDGGNSIIMIDMDTVGQINSVDVVGSSPVVSGGIVNFDVILEFKPSCMLDSFCDRFYWRRIA